MKVLLAYDREGGSDYYRISRPARAVEAAGLGISVTVQRGILTRMVPDPDLGKHRVDSVDVGDADVVVLQLPKTEAMLQIQRMLQARGIAVVVEMDDLLSGVPYGHMGHDSLVRRGMSRLAATCAREADMVTVSTPGLLAEYAPHGRGMVIPNAVPRSLAELPPAYERTPERVTVGWTGNVLVHPYDLQEMGSGLQQALDQTQGESRFLVLGQAWDVADRLRLSEKPEEVPWVPDVDEYVRTIGEVFDVGIAPLRLDKFNDCKSWLKPLEYAARGIHCVRARTSEYERLGVGHPARSPKDWSRALVGAIREGDRRRELAAAAREKVLAGHLTEHTVERWADAWRAARDHRSRVQRKGA